MSEVPQKKIIKGNEEGCDGAFSLAHQLTNL